MKQIQSMPDIWDDEPFWVMRSTVIGAFAQAAVRQSPYICPPLLDVGIRQFDNAFTSEDCFETNCQELRSDIRKAFEKCPMVQDWNVPKKGKHTVVFVSRHESPMPDYDFIDLGAMARNIAHSVTLEEKYNDLHG